MGAHFTDIQMMKDQLFRGEGIVKLNNKQEPSTRQALECAPSQISVVIVSYNSRELLRECLASIQSEPYAQVTVVDNASSDDSGEMVRRSFPWVRLILNKRNEGYGAAANTAIASCSSKYVLLLNCDTLLQPGTLQTLSDYLDKNPQAAIVGPSLVNREGKSQASCFPFPTPLQILLRETSLPILVRRVRRNHSDDLLTMSPDFARVVPWVLGAVLAIRRQAFESVGGFDPSFFMYYEEVDLCYRLAKAGWQTHFIPEVCVSHIGGASTERHRTAMASQLYKSLCHFYRQHYSRGRRFQLKLIVTYLMLRNIVRDTLRFAQINDSLNANDLTDDLLVWRSVLKSVWSANGWLKKDSRRSS